MTTKVYEIYDINGTCLYVGVTKNPKRRFRQHVNYPPLPRSGTGRFYQQQVFMKVIDEFISRQDALKKEEELQLEYGFKTNKEIYHEWSMLGNVKGKTQGAYAAAKKTHQCPRCKKWGNSNVWLGQHINSGTKACPKNA